MEEAPYKRPESVLVVVYTHGGEVLLLERREPPGFWQSVTGSLGWDETAAQAARRELAEETGLHAGAELLDCGHSNEFPILPAWRARYAPGIETNVEHVFRVGYPTRPAVRIDSAEHRALRWLPRAQAVELATSWTNRDAILRWVPDR